MTGSDLACSSVIVGGGDELTSMIDFDVDAIGLDEELELLDSSSNYKVCKCILHSKCIT